MEAMKEGGKLLGHDRVTIQPADPIESFFKVQQGHVKGDAHLLRAHPQLHQSPSFSVRPPAELKWIAELGFHNLGVQPYDDAKLLTTLQAMLEAAAAAPPPPFY